MQRRRLLELELAGDSSQLANALAAEREQVFAKMKNGAATATARYHHLPVQHVSRRLLQIEWRVVPSVQTMLEALTRHTLV